jgi:hypothetical protein
MRKHQCLNNLRPTSQLRAKAITLVGAHTRVALWEQYLKGVDGGVGEAVRQEFGGAGRNRTDE